MWKPVRCLQPTVLTQTVKPNFIIPIYGPESPGGGNIAFDGNFKSCTDDSFSMLILLLFNQNILMKTYLSDAKKWSFTANHLQKFLYATVWSWQKRPELLRSK